MKRLIAGFVILALFSVSGEAQDKGKKDDKQLVIGKVKSVDEENMKFTLNLEGGKQRTFHVNEETKFIGPKGGKGDGLKDDRLAKGYEVKVLPDKTGKNALEVHLPFRKKANADKANK